MKSLLLIGVMLLPPMGSTRLQNEKPPGADFSFVSRYGACWTNELDTAKGRFTYDLGGRSPAVVDLKLTTREMDQIRMKLESMDFWNSSKFPTVFRIPNTSNIGCGHAPHSPIFISVSLGGIEKTLSWDDGDGACQLNEEAKALREIESLIRAAIEIKPAYRDLPRETRGCA